MAADLFAGFTFSCFFPFFAFRGRFAPRTVTLTFQAGRQRRFDALHHRENRLAPDRGQLIAIKHGMIGAARPAIFGGVDVEETRHHFVAVERGKQQRRGFARAHDEFSRTIGHGGFLAVREGVRRRNRKSGGVPTNEKAREFFPGLSLFAILSLDLVSARGPRSGDPRRAARP